MPNSSPKTNPPSLLSTLPFFSAARKSFVGSFPYFFLSLCMLFHSSRLVTYITYLSRSLSVVSSSHPTLCSLPTHLTLFSFHFLFFSLSIALSFFLLACTASLYIRMSQRSFHLREWR